MENHVASRGAWLSILDILMNRSQFCFDWVGYREKQKQKNISPPTDIRTLGPAKIDWNRQNGRVLE